MCSIVARFIVGEDGQWGIITKGLSNSNDQPCICGLRRVDLVLCVQTVDITKKGLSNSNDQPCEICGLRVRVDILCEYCNSVHSRGGWTVKGKGS